MKDLMLRALIEIDYLETNLSELVKYHKWVIYTTYYYSLTVRIERSLRDDEIDELHDKIQKQLKDITDRFITNEMKPFEAEINTGLLGIFLYYE